ncbi:MAG: sulfatase-like hydrolase/transferase [Firmicutes bacterium]|nr:sulfatase-like hydrolase/transferase [Bacillota bacterium]
MLKKFLIALSFTNLCFYNVFCILCYQRTFYVRYLPTANSYLALIINELLVASLMVLAWEIVLRINKPYLTKTIKAFLFLVVLILVNDAARDIQGIDHDIIKYSLLTITFLLIIFKKTTKATVFFLLISAPFVGVIFFKSAAGFVANLHRTAPPPKPALSSTAVDNQAPRVLWLLFDELDYRIAFIDKPQGLKLPTFERFQKQAITAENAYSPSTWTKVSIPALIDGRFISGAVNDNQNLKITYRDTGDTVNWGSKPNVFSRAGELGYKTALIGEYLPYERLIGKDLTYCSWYSYYPSYVSPVDTLPANLYSQLFNIFTALTKSYIHRKNTYPVFLEESKKLAAEPAYGLTMIHIPIPHGPFFYKTPWWNQSGEGYLNSLVLADETLKQLWDVMASKGLWDSTTVILSSDHWLRKQKKYFNVTDSRIPFLVKTAGQKEAFVYQPHFNTVITQALILAILENKVTTPEDVIDWLDKHRDPVNYLPI